jgi:multidrug efflux pump subunit AcrA (membrane-fusion protein)
MKRRTLIGLVVVTLTIGLVGAAWFWKSKQQGSQWVPARTGVVIESIYGLGTVVAPKTHQIKTAVAQQIQAILVQEGDEVQAGTPLIQLGESGVNRAPFAGTVTTIPFKKGEILFPSVTALTLVNLKELHLEVALEQQSVMRIKPNQSAIVSFEALRGSRVETQVTSVFPRESQFIVKIALDKIPEGVLPGMTADVAIQVGKKENALTIPIRSIAAGKVTFRRNDKTFKESIQVGVVDGEWAEVVSNQILPGDEVLVRAK